MVFYGQKKKEIGKILRKLCEWKGVEVLNAEACPDHIHMLLSIPSVYRDIVTFRHGAWCIEGV